MTSRVANKSKLSFQIAQLRHAFTQLQGGPSAAIAETLILPAISFLESIEVEWKRCPACLKTKHVDDFGVRVGRKSQPQNYCRACSARRYRYARLGVPDMEHASRTMGPEELLAEYKEAVSAYISERVDIKDCGFNTPCWVWRHRLNNKGYGYTGVKGFGTQQVHRVSYSAYVGAIPGGLHLDHLCRVRSCCNPAHLEPVTPKENLARARPYRKSRRASHCMRGHPLTDDNRTAKGACRICTNAYAKEFRRKRTEARS